MITSVLLIPARQYGVAVTLVKHMRLIFALVVLLGLSACGVSVTSTYLISDKGGTMHVSYRDGEGASRVFFGENEVEGMLAVFRLAVPLGKAGPEESKSDMFFAYKMDGKMRDTFVLHRDGELFHDGQWFSVDKKWLYRWQSTYDPRNSRKPN